MYFKINNVDFSSYISALKVARETLVSENSGRNANGDTVIDIVNKKYKLSVSLRHTTAAEMKNFLAAIDDYVVNVSFLDPKSASLKTITAYTGTPEPDYYSINDKTIFKPMNLNFIEL